MKRTAHVVWIALLLVGNACGSGTHATPTTTTLSEHDKIIRRDTRIGQFTREEAARETAIAASDQRAIAALTHTQQPTAAELTALRNEHRDMETARSAADTLDASSRIRSEMSEARSVAARFPTAQAARDDGYVLASRLLPGIGAHWIKWTAVVEPFDVAQPAMLLFEGNELSSKLVGLSYFTQSVGPPSAFVDGGAHWHQHLAVCVVNGRLVAEGVAAVGACDHGADLIGGRDLWMLHVWIVAGFANPSGMFASMNPALCTAVFPCEPGPGRG